MRIVYPYPAYWPYVRRGAERCVHDLSTFLSKRGHQVDIITSKPGAPRISYDGQVRVVYLKQLHHPLTYRYSPLTRFYAYGLTALPWLLRKKYDVMHLWSYSGVIAAPLLQSLWRLPYLFHVIMLKHYWPGRVDRLLFRWLLRRAGRAAALTPKGAEAIHDVHGVDAEVVPPPVNMEIFRPRGSKNHRRPKVLFTGDLGDPRKGGALLLRAWDEIHRRCPEAVLVFAGPFGLSGWHPEHVGVYTLTQMKYIRSESARAAVEVRGPGSLEDLPRWYAEASVTVLPSVEEAFGMVITESLASGTPVVGSSVGGPGEIIRNPEIGATVPIREYTDLLSTRCAHQLAEAVLYAIELSRKSGTADRCREWAEQWSLERVGMRVEAILKDLASLNERPLHKNVEAGM